MPEIVKPFDGGYQPHVGVLRQIAEDCEYGDVQAVAICVIRKDKPFEISAYVNEADRSRLRAAAMELAAALAES